MLTALSIGRGGLGRMGNQMFTIAGVIGIAYKNGQPYGFPDWVNHDNANFGGHPDRLSDYFTNPLPLVPPDFSFQEYGYFWGYRDIKLQHGNWSIDSHLQSPKYFDHCMGLIRHYFTMKDEYPENDAVAIHYRAGDYTHGYDTYHPRQEWAYYEAAMKHFPGRRFSVFTDDMNAADRLFGDKVTSINSGHYIDDFKFMKSFHSFIIANSSYSAMSALLANQPGKKVVSPSRWFGTAANGLDSSDIHHESWIKI